MMQQIKESESGGGNVSGGVCQEQEFCSEEREMDTCRRGVKESFIISLSLSSTKNY